MPSRRRASIEPYASGVRRRREAAPNTAGIRGSLVAAGALSVPADNARRAERSIGELCNEFGFPAGEEFKWSPRRDSWMFRNLIEDARTDFFASVVDVLLESEVVAAVVIEEDGRSPATSAATAEEDVVALLLERVANRLKDTGETGLVVADRPGGARRQEDQFIASCLAALEAGTGYVEHKELTFVLTTDSRFVRLLQAADVATSCMTAYVAGESRYAPATAMRLLPLYPSAFDRRAGYSIKLHPSYNFANLHHWLFGESHYVRFMTGYPMPMKGFDYFNGPDSQ